MYFRNAMARASLLTQNYKYLPLGSFLERVDFFSSRFDAGDYLENPEQRTIYLESLSKGGSGNSQGPNPMSDPKMVDSMMDGAKGQMMSIVPQTLIMGWVQFFFSGFILTKLPFMLGDQFKSMLQDGILTPYADVGWVSSISFYFLNLFGLGGVFSLILGSTDVSSGTEAAGMVLPQNSNQPMPAQDHHKLFLGLAENLKIVNYKFSLENIDSRVLNLYK
ncbi:hypothetical protein BB560_005904 [Smittium megazygosporum]|uniref:ER membrane protein complex subunit 3 n=1 Tax=Smittium megazygosporum TaxID=133381 RepID=A0A2T9YRF2_9FUNG|nr:hypothetical protein BB560_005904 [Smittium megazygosporum]